MIQESTAAKMSKTPLWAYDDAQSKDCVNLKIDNNKRSSSLTSLTSQSPVQRITLNDRRNSDPSPYSSSGTLHTRMSFSVPPLKRKPLDRSNTTAESVDNISKLIPR